jgi:hypothetical protein
MSRMDYGSLETYAEQRPTAYSSDGARMALSRAVRQIWNSGQFDGLRAELSRAARSTIAPAYSRAAGSIRGAYREAAYSTGYADAARRIWGSA